MNMLLTHPLKEEVLLEVLLDTYDALSLERKHELNMAAYTGRPDTTSDYVVVEDQGLKIVVDLNESAGIVDIHDLHPEQTEHSSIPTPCREIIEAREDSELWDECSDLDMLFIDRPKTPVWDELSLSQKRHYQQLMYESLTGNKESL